MEAHKGPPAKYVIKGRYSTPTLSLFFGTQSIELKLLSWDRLDGIALMFAK